LAAVEYERSKSPHRAHLQNITVVDLANTNTVTVNVTGQGKYEYSLDEPNGPFQLSNFFDNNVAGIHEVYK
jgi:Ethanolamine utilization protein EutJ (predicted chaperonin)